MQQSSWPLHMLCMVPAHTCCTWMQAKLRRMEADLRDGKGQPAGHERGAGDWQHYQSPRDILTAVARQNQQKPPGVLSGMHPLLVDSWRILIWATSAAFAH